MGGKPRAAAPPPKADPIRVGISACILGQEVRYNGGHKLDRFIRDTLGAFVDLVPVCPEVELGLGVPRETLRLVMPGRGAEPLMIAPASGTDHTAAMRAYAEARCDQLAGDDLCGFIVQKGSPSCGMERVKLYPSAEGGMPTRDGRGLFTAALMRRFPDLPVEEDGRLNDPRLRETFVERVFAYRRARTLFASPWTMGSLVAFHAREKLLLMAHHRPAYQELGRLVATAKGRDRQEVGSEYQRIFMAGLARIGTPRKHTNVLQHIAGYFKRTLDDDDRREMHDVIDAYWRGQVPLIVPITLLRHHVRRIGVPYLAEQTYLSPHPRELMLRNHV